MTIRQLASPLCATLVTLLLLTGGCSASEAKRAAVEGANLYETGDYEAALPLLEKAAGKGLQDGDLFYQLGYIYDLKAMAQKSREFREKALPILEKKTASKGATLEEWYYLTALYSNLNRPEEMQKSAQAAVEKFGGGTGLSGEDLFRLGRLYQFAGDGGKSAAAYHSAVEAFEKEPKAKATFYALALLADGHADFQAHRFADAARKYEEVARLSPRNAPSGYNIALAHLGAGELGRARSEFGQVQDENLSTEAQYGADLARHLESLGSRATQTPEGKEIQEMDDPALEAAIQSAGVALRKARDDQAAGKDSGDTVLSSERLFFSLVAEWMLRGNAIREIALSGGYADLIRR